MDPFLDVLKVYSYRLEGTHHDDTYFAICHFDSVSASVSCVHARIEEVSQKYMKRAKLPFAAGRRSCFRRAISYWTCRVST